MQVQMVSTHEKPGAPECPALERQRLRFLGACWLASLTESISSRAPCSVGGKVRDLLRRTAHYLTLTHIHTHAHTHAHRHTQTYHTWNLWPHSSPAFFAKHSKLTTVRGSCVASSQSRVGEQPLWPSSPWGNLIPQALCFPSPSPHRHWFLLHKETLTERGPGRSLPDIIQLPIQGPHGVAFSIHYLAAAAHVEFSFCFDALGLHHLTRETVTHKCYCLMLAL